MGSDWKRSTLADVSDRPQYGAIAKGGNEYVGPLFIRQTDIVGGRIDWQSVPRCDLASTEVPKYAVKRGDILVSRLGAGVGNAAFVDEPNGAVFAGYLVRFQTKTQIAIPRFVIYHLQSQTWRDHVNGFRSGAAQPTLNAQQMGAYEFPLPPLPEQRAIAHILGTLDDKIELNRRTSETLEAMARALFKSWFVDFDPVRAKAEGRWKRGQSLPGLPAHLFDLFPSSFVDSELGEIPKGWEVKSIGDLAEVCGGTTPSTKDTANWLGGTHAWATPKDLSGLSVPVLLNTERKITDMGLAQIGSGLLPKGTVLLSSRAPIGYLAISEVPVAVNQGFIAMTPKDETSNIFLLLWAGFAKEAILSRANGSTFLEISKANFRPIPVVAPSSQVMQAFEKTVRPIFTRIVQCTREVQTLTTIRDTLLPKLISGELQVSDPDRILEDV